MNPPEPDGFRIEILAETAERPRLIDEEVPTLRRSFKLGQSRETTREVESHARDLGQESDECQAQLREAEDERRSGEIEFIDVVEYLRQRVPSWSHRGRVSIQRFASQGPVSRPARAHK